MGRSRSVQQRKQSKKRIHALMAEAKRQSKGATLTADSSISCKAWGNALQQSRKKIEVRAWSERQLRSRLSTDGAPKLGRLSWSHQGQNTIIFMYPHVSETSGWGVAKDLAELRDTLTKKKLYQQCFDPSSTDDLPKDLRCGRNEFEDFVKAKLRI